MTGTGDQVEDLAEIGREEAEQIAAGLAARSWPPDAARLYGLLILVEDRLGPNRRDKRTTSSR